MVIQKIRDTLLHNKQIRILNIWIPQQIMVEWANMGTNLEAAILDRWSCSISKKTIFLPELDSWNQMCSICHGSESLKLLLFVTGNWRWNWQNCPGNSASISLTRTSNTSAVAFLIAKFQKTRNVDNKLHSVHLKTTTNKETSIMVLAA